MSVVGILTRVLLVCLLSAVAQANWYQDVYKNAAMFKKGFAAKGDIESKRYKKAFGDKPVKDLTKEEIRKVVGFDKLGDVGSSLSFDGMTDKEAASKRAFEMADFVPDDIVIFDIPINDSAVLFETISHEKPTEIKASFLVEGKNKFSKKIACIILDPSKNILYKSTKLTHDLIVFKTTEPGEYSIIFANLNFMQTLKVTLALHTFEENRDEPVEYDLDEAGNRIVRGTNNAGKEEKTEEPLTPEQQRDSSEEDQFGNDMAATNQEIVRVKKIMKKAQEMTSNIQSEAIFSLQRQKEHNEDLVSNTNWSVLVMVVEVIIFCAILAFQLHHIKKSMDNKLLL